LMEEREAPAAQENQAERRKPHIAHQATLFLEGRLTEEGFSSPRLPRGCGVELAGHAGANPEAHLGEGHFTLWPRTDGEGRLIQVQVALKLQRPMEGTELQVHGLLLYADRKKLVVLIQPKSAEPFRLILLRARGFTARLEPKKAYRLEGSLRGRRLFVERAYPLGKWVLARKGERPMPEPIEGDRNPYWDGTRRGRRPRGEREGAGETPPAEAPKPSQAPPPPPPPEPEPEPPPPLPRGQVVGLTGSGPYWLVVRPEAVREWWPRVERFLPDLTRRHEVRTYPDGTRAVVCGDLEALKVWWKRVVRG
jgi:hypothetical protein